MSCVLEFSYVENIRAYLVSVCNVAVSQAVCVHSDLQWCLRRTALGRSSTSSPCTPGGHKFEVGVGQTALWEDLGSLSFLRLYYLSGCLFFLTLICTSDTDFLSLS